MAKQNFRNNPYRNLLFGNRAVISIVLAAAALFCASAARAASGPETVIQKGTGNGMLATLKFTGPVEVSSFYLEAPDRFVVDVAGAFFEELNKTIEVGSPLVARLRIAQNSREPQIVRIVFDLKKKARLDLKVDEAAGRVTVAESAMVNQPFPKLSVRKLDDRVEVSMDFKTATEFTREAGQYPPRVVLGFENFTAGENPAVYDVNAGVAKEARVSRDPKRPDMVRVAVETKLPARIEVEKRNQGKTIVITVFQPSVYGRTIALDPGHGGKDPGTQSGDGLDEKDINLAMAFKLRDLLEAAGAKVVMTRNSDAFISLDDRAFIANRAGADAFVSIHINSLPGHDRRLECRGTQMFYYSAAGESFARTMFEELNGALGIGDMGMYERNFAVLRKTGMKAVLVELGFLSHPNDRALLADDTFRENAARGLFNGLERYFGGRGQTLAMLKLPSELASHVPGTDKYEREYVASGNVLAVNQAESRDSSGGAGTGETATTVDWTMSEDGVESVDRTAAPAGHVIRESDDMKKGAPVIIRDSAKNKPEK